MTLVKTNGNYFPELPTFFDDFFGKDWLNTSLFSNNLQRHTLPAVNVQENNENFILEVAAPGMSKKDFHVEVDNNLLTITGQREEQKENENEGYTRREFNYQGFKRSFHLPENTVDAGKISAKYTDGILHLTLPKLETAKMKPVKKIQVS